jgi:hypothetical protein
MCFWTSLRLQPYKGKVQRGEGACGAVVVQVVVVGGRDMVGDGGVVMAVMCVHNVCVCIEIRTRIWIAVNNLCGRIACRCSCFRNR